MNDQQAKGLLGGAAIAGLLAFVVSFVAVSNPIPFLILGGVLLGLIAVLAWLSYRRGNRWFAYGLLAGYGVLTLMSAGQCTLLLEPTDAALIGFVFYPLLLVVATVAAAIASVVRSRRERKGGGE